MKKTSVIPAVVGAIGFMFLLIAYFIPVLDESGANYRTYDSLLGIIIFHNLWILAGYVFVGVVLLMWGLRTRVQII